MFNKFFSDCPFDTCLSCKDIARQSCAMVLRWQFFASCIFSEPRAAHFIMAAVAPSQLLLSSCSVYLWSYSSLGCVLQKSGYWPSCIFLVPPYPGCPGKEAMKCTSICLSRYLLAVREV